MKRKKIFKKDEVLFFGLRKKTTFDLLMSIGLTVRVTVKN